MPDQETTETVLTKDVTKETQNLLSLRLTRDATGIQVNIQSALDWAKHFRAHPPSRFHYGVPVESQEDGAPANCSRPRAGIQLSTVTAAFFTSNRLFDGATPNLSCLLCDGIKDGVVLKFPAEAVSVEALKSWGKAIRSAVVELYSGYLKKADITVRIDCRQIGHTETITMD